MKVVSDDPLLGGPGGITVGKGGKLLVSDFDGGSHAILKVNPDNGNVATVTDSNKLVARSTSLKPARDRSTSPTRDAGSDDAGASSGSTRTPGG